MVCLYKKRYFRIYGEGDAYIIHNTHKEFQQGHSHINNFHTAKWLIDLAYHKTVPHRKKRYFIQSLIRISNDDEYIKKLQPYLN